MVDVEPVVRLMLLCDDVRPDPDNPSKINALGLVSTIHSFGEAAFPFRHPQLCVYLQLTGGRGTGEGRIVVVHADSDQTVLRAPLHTLKFGTDPLKVHGVLFRLLGCVFPEPDYYFFEFWYNDKAIARQPLFVR